MHFRDRICDLRLMRAGSTAKSADSYGNNQPGRVAKKCGRGVYIGISNKLPPPLCGNQPQTRGGGVSFLPLQAGEKGRREFVRPPISRAKLRETMDFIIKSLKTPHFFLGRKTGGRAGGGGTYRTRKRGRPTRQPPDQAPDRRAPARSNTTPLYTTGPVVRISLTH